MSDVDNNPQTTRRQALRRIALFGLAAFVAPSVLTISDADAGQRSSNGSSKSKSDRNSKQGPRSSFTSEYEYECHPEPEREPTPPRGTDCGSYDNPDRCVIRKRVKVVEVNG